MDNLTDIANQALLKIGYSQVLADINTNSSVSTKLTVFLQGVIPSVQLEFWWPEFLVDLSIPADATQRDDLQLEYQLPADFLRLKKVYGDYEFDVIGNRIVSPAIAPLMIQYMKKSNNVGEWSEFFKECVYTKLASVCAKELKNDANLMQYFMQEYEQKVLPKAKTALSKDSHSSKKYSHRGGNWLKAYYGAK